MSIVFEQIRVGGDRNFGYLIGDRSKNQAAVIDPSYSPEVLVDRAKAQGLTITHIINTHGHGDHTNGNPLVKELTGAKVACYHTSDVEHEIDIHDLDQITIGNLKLQFLFVPGHAPDHVVVSLPQYQIALTGDHLFVGKIGGTRNENDARSQWNGLQRLLRELPSETTVWPGHDVGCRPSSTLQLEAVCNPFLLAKSFDEFLKVKENWADFKKEAGLV